MKLADELGTVRAAISELKEKEKQLVERAKKTGKSQIDGDLFTATVIQQERSTINWKKIAEKFNPSHQLIAGNTTIKPVISVKVVSRQSKAA